MQLKQFKIRASSVSKIMTNGRSKTDGLGQTCKSYLEEWVKEQIYNTQKQIKSKYLTKGSDVETEAIEYYADYKGLGFVVPNRDHFSSEFCQGMPDLILSDTVYEFKSSWDCFTFPLFDTDPPRENIEQLQIYMHLTGRKKGVLVYTLQNTPDELVWDEPVDYSNIAAKYRVKEWVVDYDPNFIRSVEIRVNECRRYINELIEKL
jgi:hypothetical protein